MSITDAIDQWKQEQAASTAVTPQRILYFDVETAPMLAFIWQAKTEYVGTHQIQHETFMLTWAAKWSDGRRVIGDALTPDEAIAQDDSRIVQALADLIRECDVLVGHNLNRFDVPMLNNRLLLLGLEPLGPVKTIDTLTLARKSFRLASNKLDWLAEQLGFGNKIGTSFSLWERCYRGEAKALNEMLAYNRQDVVLLEDVFERMHPYLKNSPRLVDANTDGVVCCPHCGADGEHVERSGHHRTNSSTFERFRCTSCGRHSRSRTADRSKRLALMPM